MNNKLNELIKNKGLKKIALVLALLLIINASISGTVAYLMYKTNSMVNTFVSGVDPLGSIKITKTVEHDYGKDYIIPDGISFPFEIDLGTECANKTFGIYTTDENGAISLSMKADSEITIGGIPEGTEVTVKETGNLGGFTVDGESEITKTVSKSNVASFDFINVYKATGPDFGNIEIAGTKTIDGRDWTNEDSYTILLEQYDGKDWKEVAKKNVDINNKTFDFTETIKNLEISNIGTYSFRISEVKGSVGGVVYDTNVSYIDVIVSDDDMDGKMEIASINSESANTKITKDKETGKTTVEISFVNKYAPEGSAEAYINITKELEAVSGTDRTLGGYTFSLYDEKNKLIGEATTNALGKATIRKVFTTEDIGEYSWTLKENNLKEPGIIYDESIYKIRVSVVDNLDGTISAYIYDAKYASKPIGADNEYEATFKNKYAPAVAEKKITANKILKGRDLKNGEFSFVLKKTDDEFNPGIKIAESTNTRNGEIAFNNLTFNSAGTYYYLLEEKRDGEAKGITYDKSVYRIKVNVLDDKNGHLYTDTEVYKASKGSIYPVDKIEFTNKYKKPVNPPSDEDKPSGVKTGDTNNLLLWLFLLLSSIEALIITLKINLGYRQSGRQGKH